MVKRHNESKALVDELVAQLAEHPERAIKLGVVELPPSDDPGRFEIWTDEYRVWVHPLSRDVCVQLYQSAFTTSQGEGLAAAIIAAVEASHD